MFHISEGNTFFKNKQYKEAIQKYTEAIALDQGDVTFYSNRSACYAALNMWNEASEDGRQCIMTDKSFVKGYFRQALGLQNLGNLDAALDVVKRGLGIDSQNADMIKMSRDIEEAQRLEKVDAAIAQAQSREADRDNGAAVESIDAALRLDPTIRSGPGAAPSPPPLPPASAANPASPSVCAIVSCPP